MQFLVDEDLPRSSIQLIERYGHIGIFAGSILAGATDKELAARAKTEGLCILTGDFGFADIRNYAPSEYAGIVVLQLTKDATAKSILAIIAALLEQPDLLLKIPGRLAIVERNRVRLRPRSL